MAAVSSTQTTERSRAEAHFRLQVIDALIAEPIEDGIGHPAEDLIAQALTRGGKEAACWVRDLYRSLATTQPTLAAGVIRCASRLRPSESAPWGDALAAEALGHADAEVREAAVRALEAWGGPTAIALLRRQLNAEPIAWLASYIRRVISDLSE